LLTLLNHFSGLFFHLLDHAPNHSKLNEIAPAVTGAISLQLVAPYDNSWPECFLRFSISAKTNRLFFYHWWPRGEKSPQSVTSKVVFDEPDVELSAGYLLPSDDKIL
jgi:hypothetical protein